jgi:hypothetical protein
MDGQRSRMREMRQKISVENHGRKTGRIISYSILKKQFENVDWIHLTQDSFCDGLL